MGLIQSMANKVNPASNILEMPDQWPPASEQARLGRYFDYRKIFEGKHEQVLDARHLAQDYDLYVACNIPGLEPRIIADLMLGEPVSLEFPDDTSDKAQEAVTRIWEDNDLQTLAYENVLETAPLGDGIFVVSRGEDELASVRTFQPEQWFPVLNDDNVRDVQMHKLCWVKKAKIDGKEREFLRTIEHHKGKIVNALFLLEGGRVRREATEDEWSRFYEEIPEPEIATEVDEFLVVHVPNMRTAREYFGRSDYEGRTPLFSMLDSRLTQVDQILHRHSNPSLKVPGEAYDALTKRYPAGVPVEELRMLRMGMNGEGPDYMTWDGQITQNLATIDMVVEKILMTGEIDRQLVGLGDTGNLSGRALRLLLMRTLAKVGRKWDKYVKPALEQVLYLAQLVEGLEPVDVTLRRSDGLPSDRLEDIQASRELVDGGFSSRKREIQKLNDMSEEDAEELIAEIDGEGDVTRNSPSLNDAIQRTPIAVNVSAEDLQ